MPWVIGIDEAGYGPYLGPLVQAAVGLYLPDADPAGWDTLRPVVRRCGEKKDGRILIDDSKKVYTRGGLKALELAVLSVAEPVPTTVQNFLEGVLLPGCLDDIRGEGWYAPDDPLPLEVDRTAVDAGLGTWAQANQLTGGGMFGRLASVTPAPLFNKVLDGSDSKATILGCGLVSLMRQLYPAGRVGALVHPDEPLLYLCDKQGGRNFYAGLIQQAFPDGWVVAECETADESRYRVERLDRAVTVVFRPRADAASVCVSLASMLAKYLREVCMLQFNRYWATHVPGIKPTAGYPVDAKRFYAEIEPAMAKLGLTPDQVWRKR